MTAHETGRAGAAAGAADRTRRRRGSLLLLGLALLLLLLPAPAPAQQGGGTDGGASVEATADPAADGSAARLVPAGEPFVAPRSGRAYSHVFLAFGIAWALMLGFVVVLGRRFAAVERDLSRLRAGGE